MSRITDEMLMAYADGELEPGARVEVERALAEDPALRGALDVQQRLRSRLAGHFAPVADEPPPPRLTALLGGSGAVADLAAARERKSRRFAWPELAAIAASLALGVTVGQVAFGPRAGPVAIDGGTMLARGELAEALETRLASNQPHKASARIGISFEDRSGRFCRTFELPALAGIACREEQGWAVAVAASAPASGADYRQAGSAMVMEQAEAMMASDPLDADAEKRALARGWR